MATKPTRKKPAKPRLTKAQLDELRIQGEKKVFLEKLAKGYTVKAACEAIKVSRGTPYRWADADKEFKRDWDYAVVDGVETLEDAARDRAVDGVEEPIISMGEVVGTKIKYSDPLLMFLLKARDPAKYGDKSKVTLDGKLDTGALSDEELDAKIQSLIGAAATK